MSVDTIRFYQKRRLLAAPAREGRVAWYGPEHLERLARIRELQAQGLTLALIGRVLERRSRRHRRAPRGRGRRRRRARGVPLARASSPSAPACRTALLEAVAREGLLVPRVHDGDRALHDRRRRRRAAPVSPCSRPASRCRICSRSRARTTTATHDIAEHAVALFDRYVRTPLRASTISDDEKAQRLVEAFRRCCRR